MNENIEQVIRSVARDEALRVAKSSNASLFDDRWVNTKQASQITGMSKSWFETARSECYPDQPPFSGEGKGIRYRVSDLHAWMESRKRYFTKFGSGQPVPSKQYRC